MCTINELLVKVFRLVDGDKHTMGYLHEAIDWAKVAIHVYYEKGDEGHERQQLI